MVEYSDKDGKLTFQVQVVPRAARSEVVGEHNGALRVRVAAPPVDGAANAELIHILARALGVSRSAIEIIRGHSGKLKTVRILGARPSSLESLF
jgi:uncharacterized protein